MKRRLTSSIFGVLCLVLGAVEKAPAQGVSLPVPPQAREVRNVSPDGAWLQTSYIVDALYPDISVAQFYQEKVNAPWLPCFEDIPEWESFGDVANGNNRFVHRLLMYWADKDERKLLMVVIQYFSPGSTFQHAPENSTQYVSLAEYSRDNIEQSIEELGLECAPAPDAIKQEGG